MSFTCAWVRREFHFEDNFCPFRDEQTKLWVALLPVSIEIMYDTLHNRTPYPATVKLYSHCINLHCTTLRLNKEELDQNCNHVEHIRQSNALSNPTTARLYG